MPATHAAPWSQVLPLQHATPGCPQAVVLEELPPLEDAAAAAPEDAALAAEEAPDAPFELPPVDVAAELLELAAAPVDELVGVTDASGLPTIPLPESPLSAAVEEFLEGQPVVTVTTPTHITHAIKLIARDMDPSRVPAENNLRP